MQIGCLYSTATPRMALMESRKPVCWIRISARLSEPGGDADAFVLFADADEAQRLVLRDRRQESGARGDVRHRKDVFDAAQLDGGYDGRAAELAFGFGRCRAAAHPGSPSCRSMPTAVNVSLDWIVTRSKKAGLATETVAASRSCGRAAPNVTASLMSAFGAKADIDWKCRDEENKKLCAW